MALIGTIRKQSMLLVIIVGVALAAFVLGDFLSPRQGRKNENIAEVLGEDITFIQFNQQFEQNLENQKRNQQKDNFTAEELFQLRQQTFDQIIQKVVLNDQYDKLGLSVSAEELFDQIQGENPHSYILQYFKDPETQQYDPELVRNYIKQLDQMDQTTRTQWDIFINAIKEDRERKKYTNLVTKGYLMPDTFIYMDFNEKKISANARLVGVRFMTISDSLVKVTDKDIEKYYEDYKQNYKQQESRDIDYVVFEVKPSAKDRQNIMDYVYRIYNDFRQTENVPLFVNAESDKKYDSTFFKQGQLPIAIDTIAFKSEPGTFIQPYIDNNSWHMAKLMEIQSRPDSMKASHILVSYQGAFRTGEGVTRSKERAEILADSLLNVIKKEPSRMEILAAIYSDDPSARENTGDLGWFADGAMGFPFNNAVLTHEVGDITMAESQFGYHVIKVTGKKEMIKKVRVAVIDVAINPSQETYQDEYARASEYQGKASTLVAFDTLAPRYGLSKRTANNIQKMGDRIAGLDYPREIIRWSFMEGIGVGSVSPVITLEDKYVVAAVTKITEEGIPSWTDLRDVLEPLVIKDLKGDKVVEKMNAAASETSNLLLLAEKLGSKVDTVANITFSSRNISSFGNEGILIARIFNMDKGVISQPIKGNNAAFFAIVDEIIYPAPGENKKVYEKQLLMNFRSKISNNSYLTMLQEKADFVDNRIKVY